MRPLACYHVGPETEITLERNNAMAKPNYSYEKRQKEIAKKKKQEEKRLKKLAAKDDRQQEETGRSESDQNDDS